MKKSLLPHLFQLNQQQTTSEELNGFINNSPIYVTSFTTPTEANNPTATTKQQYPVAVSTTVTTSSSGGGDVVLTQQFTECGGNGGVVIVDNKQVVQNDVRVTGIRGGEQHHQLIANKENLEVTRRSTTDRRSSSPFQNGRTELLIGNEDNKVKTTAVVESNNNKLGIETENR